MRLSCFQFSSFLLDSHISVSLFLAEAVVNLDKGASKGQGGSFFAARSAASFTIITLCPDTHLIRLRPDALLSSATLVGIYITSGDVSQCMTVLESVMIVTESFPSSKAPRMASASASQAARPCPDSRIGTVPRSRLRFLEWSLDGLCLPGSTF